MEVTGDRVVHSLESELGKEAGRIDGKLVKGGKTVDPEDTVIAAIAIQKVKQYLQVIKNTSKESAKSQTSTTKLTDGRN